MAGYKKPKDAQIWDIDKVTWPDLWKPYGEKKKWYKSKMKKKSKKYEAFIGRQAKIFFFNETSMIAAGVSALSVIRLSHDPIDILTWISSESLKD